MGRRRQQKRSNIDSALVPSNTVVPSNTMEREEKCLPILFLEPLPRNGHILLEFFHRILPDGRIKQEPDFAVAYPIHRIEKVGGKASKLVTRVLWIVAILALLYFVCQYYWFQRI